MFLHLFVYLRAELFKTTRASAMQTRNCSSAVCNNSICKFFKEHSRKDCGTRTAQCECIHLVALRLPSFNKNRIEPCAILLRQRGTKTAPKLRSQEMKCLFLTCQPRGPQALLRVAKALPPRDSLAPGLSSQDQLRCPFAVRQAETRMTNRSY